jgi:hypothetical protein
MVWRSVAAFIVAPLGALLVMAPLLADDALAQRHDRDRDRGADRGRGPDRGDRGQWELLGSTRIGGFRIDRDTIKVGRDEGRFARIGLQVREGSVRLLEVVVVYGNNEVQRIDLRQHLREGERTPPIDLKGRGRFVKRIEVAARARRGRGHRRHRAILEVYGETARSWHDGWEELGEKKVNRRVDRDTIRVGRKEGRFAKIALEVKDNDVEIRDLKVFFRHGRPQDVEVRERIRAGGHTRAIDLRGGDRIIERIELVYRTRGRGERATVTVYGLQGAGGHRPGPPRRGHWEELGCQRVGFGADKDVIKVGRREGRFSAIRLRAKRSDVLLLSLRVVYGRGPADDFDVQTHLRAGRETRPFDLRGERRAIKRIELVYSSIPSLKGAATLCADGRQ